MPLSRHVSTTASSSTLSRSARSHRTPIAGKAAKNSSLVADLRLWRLGPGHLGLVAAIVSDAPQSPDAYKARLAGVARLSHVTIEVHACANAEPPQRPAGAPGAVPG
jgi:hypothetical protein